MPHFPRGRVPWSQSVSHFFEYVSSMASAFLVGLSCHSAPRKFNFFGFISTNMIPDGVFKEVKYCSNHRTANHVVDINF